MSWLDEAKKRAESLKLAHYFPQGGVDRDAAITEVIIRHDAPRAYALLERAEEALQSYVEMALPGTRPLPHEAAVGILRDLEGKKLPA